uniref:PLAC domain-containing protein n=1 Tax=Monopterus albus TaxID=43700 RepID=A0A3Q3QDT7_MONAL
QATNRRSRQVFEAEPLQGVWSAWGEWSECSQTCGVGVSQRSRKCLPPSPPQTPSWAGYLPGGIRDPVISPVHPYHPSRYPGQHLPYQPLPTSTNQNPGLPLYRNTPVGEGSPMPAQANPSSPFYQSELSPANQDLVSGYRSPFHTPSHSYSQPARIIRRPANPGAARAGGAGSRRSVSTNQGGLPVRSSIRPGQFGYGRVPFSLPLHRPNRQARHTVNGTGAATPVVCGGGALDSRAEQCAAFNTQEFMGRLYDWEPFTEGVDKQCELTCRPAGYRFYVRQAERVRDGTPCFNVNASDVCVEGRCLQTEGCDGVLGSGSTVDKCGVCGGQETTCRKVTGSFQNVTVPLGYQKILEIPPGATFINITERRASPNYLAMRSGTGASVVNGRWAVDPPGVYQAGGTTFTYMPTRTQAEGEEGKGESLTAPGPTTTQLLLYIIFYKDNPGIDYEFYIPVEKKEGEREWLIEREREPPREEHPPPGSPPVVVPSFPSSSSSYSMFSPSSSDRWTPERLHPQGSAPNRNIRIPPRTDLPLDTQPPFVWRTGGLTECSASCGQSQHRVILCINRHTDEEVPERQCDSAARPVPEEEPCNTQPCPPWEASEWSECSVSCGPGVQQRQLQCRQSFGQRSTMVHPQRCAHLTPPESTQPCELSLCSHWEVSSDWSTQCSVDCGVGRRTRSVRCVSDQGSIVNDKECNSRLRPQGTEECNMGPCVTNWYFTDWSSTCSAQCGPGVQRREVVCLTRGGVREGGGGECVGEKPAEMKACNGGPCVPTAMWYSSPWTQCNVPCGNGTQRRDIICVQKMGNDVAVVSANECAHLDKPAAVQECETGECQPQWFTTEWSSCSRSCGKGLQMREVRCLMPDKKHSHECDSNTKPEQEQMCNILPCGPQVSENCRDRRHNCVMVVQARLCVYSYYKTACCASCTQSAQRAKRH